MNVAILTNIPAPYRVPVWNALQDAGVDLSVFFASTSAPGREWVLPTGMKFKWKVPWGMGSGRWRVPLGLPFELLQLRPGLILLGDFGVLAALALTYVAIRGGRTRLALFGEATELSERGMHPWKRRWRRWLVGRATAFFAASSDARDYFVSLGAPPSRVHVSMLTADLERFSPSSRRLRERRPVARKILYCGTLSDKKGINDLLGAYAIVKSEIPDATLVLVGSDDLTATERERVQRTPDLLQVGFRQQRDLPPYYWDADLFVFPTHCDRFGVVVVEALAAGLPVVCSKYAGCARDLLREGENGFIVDPVDHRVMARRIIQILRSPADSQAMSHRSLEVAERCRPELVIGPILAFLREGGPVWNEPRAYAAS